MSRYGTQYTCPLLDEIIKIANDSLNGVCKNLTGDEKNYDEIDVWITDLEYIEGKCDEVRGIAEGLRGELEKSEDRITELEKEVEELTEDGLERGGGKI